jgi:hypothetical protein
MSLSENSAPLSPNYGMSVSGTAVAACTAIDRLPNLVLPGSIAVYGYAILSADVTVTVGAEISVACSPICSVPLPAQGPYISIKFNILRMCQSKRLLARVRADCVIRKI